MRMQLLRERWATSRELQLESTVLSLEQIRIYWSSGQRKKAPEWQWCLGKCIVCHGRTAEDPSETGQVFCQQFSLWHTQILSYFCANTLLLLSTSLCFFETLKGWTNLLLNITFCLNDACEHLEKETYTQSISQSYYPLSLEGSFVPWWIGQGGINVLGPLASQPLLCPSVWQKHGEWRGGWGMHSWQRNSAK